MKRYYLDELEDFLLESTFGIRPHCRAIAEAIVGITTMRSPVYWLKRNFYCNLPSITFGKTGRDKTAVLEKGNAIIAQSYHRYSHKASPEYLFDDVAEHPFGMLKRDEISGLFKEMSDKKYMSGEEEDMSIIIDGADSPMVRATISGGVKTIHECFFNVISASVTELFAKVVSKERWLSGQLARWQTIGEPEGYKRGYIGIKETRPNIEQWIVHKTEEYLKINKLAMANPVQTYAYADETRKTVDEVLKGLYNQGQQHFLTSIESALYVKWGMNYFHKYNGIEAQSRRISEGIGIKQDVLLITASDVERGIKRLHWHLNNMEETLLPVLVDDNVYKVINAFLCLEKRRRSSLKALGKSIPKEIPILHSNLQKWSNLNKEDFSDGLYGCLNDGILKPNETHHGRGEYYTRGDGFDRFLGLHKWRFKPSKVK